LAFLEEEAAVSTSGGAEGRRGDRQLLPREQAEEVLRLSRTVEATSGVAERTVAARVVSVEWPGADRAAKLATKLRHSGDDEWVHGRSAGHGRSE